MKYKIYTDGACSGNPGPGGWAVIILANNEIKEMFSGNALALLYDIDFESRRYDKRKKKRTDRKAMESTIE